MLAAYLSGPPLNTAVPATSDVGAGLDAFPRRLGIDAAIDLEIDRPARGVDRLAQGGDLGELALDEGLAAEAGIDAHHQHEIEVAQHVLDGGDRRRRVEHAARLLAQALDELDRAVDVRARLGMERDRVGAGLGIGRHHGIDRRDHQMDVERQAAVLAQRLHHHRADGDVGHEVAVHHVDMDPVGAGRRRPPRSPCRARRSRPTGSRARCGRAAAAWSALGSSRARPRRRVPALAAERVGREAAEHLELVLLGEELELLERQMQAALLGMALDLGIELRLLEARAGQVALELDDVDAVGGEAAQRLVERRRPRSARGTGTPSCRARCASRAWPPRG